MLAIRKGNFFVELELHSVNPAGDELFTFRHCHERFIHSEFMTYRVNRNASSSRAIPYKRMKEWILQDPAMPLHLGKNRPGMSVGAEIGDPVWARNTLNGMIQGAFDDCDYLHENLDLHKEIVNRYLEPFGWINVVSTWNRPQLTNAVSQRCTPEAATNIQRLFISMLRLVEQSTPQRLNVNDWHIPFVRDKQDENLMRRIVWSVARCAWVSLKTVDDREATYEDAARRHDGCIEHLHMTPCEHQKRAFPGRKGGTTSGWIEYRHAIPGQMTTEVDTAAILRRYKGRDFITKDGE